MLPVAPSHAASLMLLALLLIARPAASAPMLDDEHPREPLIVGELVHFSSNLLGENRPITVQRPEVLPDGGMDVVLVLDAETHAFHVSGIVDFMSHEYVGAMAPALVVGVVNTNRLRDTTPTATERWTEGGGVRAFVAFLADELLPWISATYPTTGKVTLVGHSGSGLAAMYALLDRPEAFSSIIAVDPSVDWDGGVFFKDAEQVWDKRPSTTGTLLLSSYKNKEWIADMKKLLRKRASRKLDWTIELYEGKTHASMVHLAVHDALLTIAEDK